MEILCENMDELEEIQYTDENIGEEEENLDTMEHFSFKLNLLSAKDNPDDPEKKDYIFSITKKENDLKEDEEELEEIENTESELNSELPESSIKESKRLINENELEEIDYGGEEELENVDNPEESTELENDENAFSYEFKEDELLDFITSLEIQPVIKSDEDTPISLEEAINYLKLYPERDIYLIFNENEAEDKFETSLNEFKQKLEDTYDDMTSEDNNLVVSNDNQFEFGDEKNIQKESVAQFSIMNIKNQKNILDGIYIFPITENNNKLYGKSFKTIFKENKISVNGKEYELMEKINLNENKSKNQIQFKVKNGEEFLKYIKEISEVIQEVKIE